MRKLGALSLVTFYLLLTTGVFTCLVHCLADSLLSRTGILITNDREDHYSPLFVAKHEHDKGKDDCEKDKDCSCCDKHGTYVIRENLTSSPELSLDVIHLIVLPFSVDGLLYVHRYHSASIRWPQTTGPPWFPHLPIYLSKQSLLI